MVRAPQSGLMDPADGELIPLPEATAVAYDLISNRVPRVADPSGLEEARGVIALALSALAPFYVLREGAAPLLLSADEVEKKIGVATARGPRYRIRAPDIDRIYIKRGDFIRAVENLKMAGAQSPRFKR
jgi:hypothetical protein